MVAHFFPLAEDERLVGKLMNECFSYHALSPLPKQYCKAILALSKLEKERLRDLKYEKATLFLLI